MKRRKRKQKEYHKRLFICILVVMITLGLGYWIQTANFYEPKVNEITASFISFNNKNTTDMLRINNIEKMGEKRGNSIWNSHSLVLNISGDKNQLFEIVLYPLNNPVEDPYIWYTITSNKEIVKQNLQDLETTEDGGKVLYRGTVQKEKLVVRLWIAKDYPEQVEENAFEIKVRPR